MPLTVTEYYNSGTFANGADCPVTGISLTSGDLITVEYVHENFGAGINTSCSVTSGTAITFTRIIDVRQTSNCIVQVWKGTAAATETITITAGTDGGSSEDASCKFNVFTGQHATDPIPAGNIFSGYGTTDVNQSITPSSIGSMLRGAFGDWSAGNTFSARSGLTITDTTDTGGGLLPLPVVPHHPCSPEPLRGH